MPGSIAYYFLSVDEMAARLGIERTTNRLSTTVPFVCLKNKIYSSSLAFEPPTEIS
jgi:hypothetical protein